MKNVCIKCNIRFLLIVFSLPAGMNPERFMVCSISILALLPASFIRLKNVELAYTLPKNIVEKMKLQNVRLILSGTNLFTFDKIKIQDPESDATGTGQAYPQARTYSFAVNVSF